MEKDGVKLADCGEFATYEECAAYAKNLGPAEGVRYFPVSFDVTIDSFVHDEVKA